jgi:hypothetical protein
MRTSSKPPATILIKQQHGNETKEETVVQQRTTKLSSGLKVVVLPLQYQKAVNAGILAAAETYD